MNNPQLSIVIIGRNEGERLEHCIRSVQTMNNPFQDIEIIYVDSNSTDDSLARAQALGAQTLEVHPERPAAAIGRNAGWRAAKAPFILFLDGDTLLHPDFVKVAWQQLTSDAKIAIVWGHRRERFPQSSIYQRVLDLEWIYPPGISRFCGGDALMRRQVLEEVDGYNPLLIAGEEPEMCQRIRAKGYVIWHIDQPMTLHDLAIKHWAQYWKRATRAGHAFAEISNLLRQSSHASIYQETTGEILWQREARKNLRHATALMSLFLLGIISSVVMSSFIPLGVAILVFVLLSLRTAWKARWKSDNWITLVLYGLHSQFQHLPIALGQLSYYYHLWRGKRRRLIEYK
jgi:glycosyltransferase involved in cell wall biosynthesis